MFYNSEFVFSHLNMALGQTIETDIYVYGETGWIYMELFKSLWSVGWKEIAWAVWFYQLNRTNECQILLS